MSVYLMSLVFIVESIVIIGKVLINNVVVSTAQVSFMEIEVYKGFKEGWAFSSCPVNKSNLTYLNYYLNCYLPCLP